MHATVKGLSTGYLRLGEGKSPKVLVLHGWGDSSAGWTDMAERLARHCDVVIPDLPGFGDTETPATAWDLNDYGVFAAAFIKKINFQPDVIVAHSNGGAIAIRAVATGVVQTDKLVLLSSSGLRTDYKGRTKSIRMLTKTGKYLTSPFPAFLKKRISAKVYKVIGADMLVKEDLQETFKRIVTDDIQANAAALRLPTLLMYGEADEATPVAFGRILHSLIDGSSLEILANAGHFAHVDSPRIVEKRIVEFIE